MINPNNDFKRGFFRISTTLVLGIIFIQIVSLLMWSFLDGDLDLFYPVRVVGKIDFKNIFSFDRKEAVLPLYNVILNIFLVESLYIIFIVSFMKILDLIFNSLRLKVTFAFCFLGLMIGVVFTKYSAFSFLSYGKFLNILRGHETIYNGSEFLSITLFLICSLIMISVLTATYLYKKYILNDNYI